MCCSESTRNTNTIGMLSETSQWSKQTWIVILIIYSTPWMRFGSMVPAP